MKKLLLSLLTVLVILTSCEKEDDLFTPVNPPNTNTNMNNTDTTTVNNTDTTTVGNTDTIINNNGEVTVLTPSQTANLKQWNNGLIRFYDGPGSPSIQGVGMQGVFATTTYPMNSNQWPAHSLNGQEEMMLNFIKSYSYTPGILSLDLLSYACGGDIVEWSVEMIVTEYSDGTIELSIDQGPNTTMDGQITWDSHLKLTLQKNF